ncbi:MAG: aspartate aminotransferase family protein, partial [Candidatus Bathyarchaeia archaeon]
GYLHEKLQDLYDLQSVGDIRGLGLFVSVELVEDKESKKPFTPDTLYHRRVVNRCFENKLLVYPGSGTVDGVRGTINRLLLH